jgi:hypothetical protein
VAGGAANWGPAPTWTQLYNEVIAANCAPCHSAPSGTGFVIGGLDLSTAQTAYTELVNADAIGSACNGVGKRVSAGDPERSIVYLKVEPSEPSPCGSKMPFHAAPLGQNEIEAIGAWIVAGAHSDVR